MKQMTNGHWNWHTAIDPIEYVGFIYKITEIDTGKLYIGKKHFWSRTKSKYRESNWKSYTSSSKDLNEQIKLKGKDNYQFDIISLHYNKSYLNYRELEELVFADALRAILPSGEKLYYNKAIGNIKFIHQDIMSETQRKKCRDRMLGKNNHMYGKTHSDEAKQKIRSRDYTSISGKNNHMYGKTHSDEAKQKIGESSKGRNLGRVHTETEISNIRLARLHKNENMNIKYDKNANTYRVRIIIDRKEYYLGSYKNKDDAIIIRDKSLEEVFKTGNITNLLEELKKTRRKK